MTKKTPGAVKEVGKAEHWYGRYRDRNGKQVQVKLAASKETARRMLLKLANDASLAKVGIEDMYADSRKRPLLEHLDDFGRYLAGKDRVEEYVARTAAQVKAIVEGCGFQHFDNMEPTAVVEYLDGLRGGEPRPTLPPRMETFTAQDLALLLEVKAASIWRMVRRGQLECTGKGRKRHFTRSAVQAYLDGRRGPGISTSNHYLQSIKQFSRWLWRNRRAPDDALVSLSRQNAKVDVRRRRRALSEQSFIKFVEATVAGRPFRGLSGHDRLTIYTLAANTGLRASELGSLTPASFSLDGAAPEVVVEAAYSEAPARGPPATAAGRGGGHGQADGRRPPHPGPGAALRAAGAVPGRRSAALDRAGLPADLSDHVGAGVRPQVPAPAGAEARPLAGGTVG